MTEEIAATPGWVDGRLDELFAGLGTSADIAAARTAYADCLASGKAPGAPSDILGAEFATCRAALHQALLAAGIDGQAVTDLEARLEALEAEIAGGS